MKTIEEYIDLLPDLLRSDPLVERGISELRTLEIDGVKKALAGEVHHKRGKPYLHALDTKMLKQISYDDIAESLDTLDSRIGSLYVHLPFCTKKCTFCTYYKEIGVPKSTIDAYPDYLGKELTYIKQKLGLDELSAYSIHFGGGTPSLLTIGQWQKLLDHLTQQISIESQDEVAIECSPEDVTREKAGYWHENGINRISLGIQSFDPSIQTFLKRQHTTEIAQQSYAISVDAGFENINIDLMYGMPRQTLASWLTDIREIVRLQPPSVTIYATRPDPTDSLEKFPQFPGDNERAFALCIARCAFLDMGYIQYSPNQFIKTYKGACIAKRERNRGRNILGVGALAHSIITNWFYMNQANLNAYQQYMEEGTMYPLKGAQMSEMEEKIQVIQFGLKLSGINKPSKDNGIIKDEYVARFGEDINTQFGPQLDYLKQLDLIVEDDSSIHLSSKGILITRDVVRFFAASDDYYGGADA